MLDLLVQQTLRILIMASLATGFARAEKPAAGLAMEGFPVDAKKVDLAIRSLGTRPALIGIYLQWNEEALPGLLKSLEAIRAAGAIPVVTWEPMVIRDQTEQVIGAAAITSGSMDAYIRKTASVCRDFGGLLILRFAHEMNLARYHWPEKSAGAFGEGSPERYVAMYQHTWKVFHEGGTPNVLWAFCPNNESIPQADWNSTSRYFPGTRFVDLLGLDGYNWGTTQTYEKHGWQSHWRSFADLFDPALKVLRSLDPEKPVLIFETATSVEGGDKAAWFREGLAWAAEQQILAVVWFDIQKEIDWRIAENLPPGSVGPLLEGGPGAAQLRERLAAPDL